MSTSIFINGGFSSTDKTPGFYGEVAPAQGAISAGSLPLKLLLVGMKTSDGSMVVEQDVVQLFSEADAITYGGQRSQIRRMAKAAFAQGQNIQVYAAACAEPSSSPVAAFITVTFTVTTPWTSTIQYTGSLAGEDVVIGIPVGYTPTQIAAAYAAAVNAVSDLPFVATSAAGVVTITAANLGTSGNAYLYYQDLTQAPGLGAAVVGGTTVGGGGIPFSGGVGTESVTNVLAVLFPSQFDRIVQGQIDAVSLAAWKAQLAAQAMPTEGKLQQAITATNGSYAAATTTATTTLNTTREQIAQLLNSEAPPWELAAAIGAIRVGAEQNDPNASFDNVILKGIRPQRNRADWLTHSQGVALLNNGVTPLISGPDGYVRIVRAIASRSLNGTTPDYRQLDVGTVTTPDFVLTDLKLLWSTGYLPANPRVEPDPPNQIQLPAGVATPSTWGNAVTGYLMGKALEPNPICLPPTTGTTPQPSWNSASQSIQAVIPVVVTPNHHQMLVSIRPTALSL